MLKHLLSAALLAAVFASSTRADSPKVRVLIIDGQNNHDWRSTTPLMKKELESCGRFTVKVATAPLRPGDAPNKKKFNSEAEYKAKLHRYQDLQAAYRKMMEQFHPDLSKYDVILSNYNGDSWSKAFSKDFDNAVKSGKIGLVIVHAADNSFSGWADYNRMIGMGWRGANFGDRLTLDKQGKEVRVPKGKGLGTSHRYTGEFEVVIRDPDHPITKGMPREWKHARDELYDNLRGPIENVTLLATAYSPGTKQDEPMLFTIGYGKGRVFHTPMGHDTNAMRCVGFITTLQRGTEWAATGAVTIPIPPNFPTASKTSTIPAK